MIEDKFVSPKELAQAIGASESSLKRWVDRGRIRVSRTAGGHRRISLRDAISFIRESGLELVNPEALGMGLLPTRDGTSSPVNVEADDALVEALVRGDAEVARRIIVSRFVAGATVPQLCDGPVSEALVRVGSQWQHRSDGIFIEHRTTFLALKNLIQLRGLIPDPPQGSPVAVGGAVAADPYLVPTSMVATVLAAEGWLDINLGANTPASAFCEAIRTHNPDLVWLSFSAQDGAEKFVREWKAILDLAEERKIRVVVGGRAFPVRAAAAQASRFHHLPNMQALVGFVRALQVIWRTGESGRKNSKDTG